MADNLFGLLQQARQVATTGDARMFGLEVAIVTNVKDPEKLGRVKVCLPRLPGKPESDWVRVAQPAAGPGRGFYWLPHVNDEVVIAFERGEAHRPFVLGSVWNGKDAPMQGAYADENSTHMIQTKSGHQIVLDDAKDAEKIVIADKSGKRTLTFDVKNKKLLIEGAEGDVEIKAAKKIVFQCEDFELKTSKKGKVEVGTSLDVKIDQKGGIKAGPRLDLKAGKVNLNPGSLNVAELVEAAMAALQSAAPAPAAAPPPPPAAAPPPPGGGGDLSSGGTAPGAGAGGPAAKGGGAPAGAGTSPAAAEAPAQAGPAAGPAAAAQAPAAAPAGTQAATAADQLDVQIVNANGTSQKSVQVELTLPDGKKQAGKTDENGRFKLAGLTMKGNAKLDVPDVQVAPAAPASAPGRVRFVQGGVDVPIGKSTVVELPSRVRRCRMRGMHFDTAKTFLLPSAMTGIRQLVKLYKSFEGIVGLVNGHTDKQGDAAYNRGLSNERAESIKAFLTDDAGTWTKWYGSMPSSKSWGVREDQLMLSSVKDGSGAPFYTGPIDGKAASAKDAYKSFQHARLLTGSGAPDKDTRLELVRAYMAQDGTSLDKGATLSTHGCGMTHPLPETRDDPNPDQPANRRVEVFLFEEKIDPQPRSPCPSAGCAEYDKWVEQKILDVDLDQPPGTLEIKVVAENGSAIDGAQVHASGPLVQDGPAPGGAITFADLVPGSYKVIADANDFFAADTTVEVPAGGSGKATLTLKPEKFGLDVRVVSEAKTAIAGAKVTIDAPGIGPATADQDGIARFAALPRGTFRLTASHEGFKDGSAETAVPRPPAADAPATERAAGDAGAGVTIPLSSAAPVLHPGIVEVRDSFDQPIPGVRVEVIGLVDQPTDGKGQVKFSRPETMAKLGLNVSKPGFSHQAQPFEPDVSKFIEVAPPADGGIVPIRLTQNRARLTVLVRQNDAAKTGIGKASVGVDGITAANQDTPDSGLLGPFDIRLEKNATVRQRVHVKKAGFGKAPAPGGAFDPATIDSDIEAFQELKDGDKIRLEVVLVAGLELKTFANVACPGLDFKIEAIPATAGGTFAWTSQPGGMFVDAAGAALASPTDKTVLFRCFQPDNAKGELPERKIEVALTFTASGKSTVFKKTVTVHAIQFSVGKPRIESGVTRALETSGGLGIVQRNAPGKATIEVKDANVKIVVPASCPAPDVCAQNHRVGWLQTMLTNVRERRYTDTLWRVALTPPLAFPIRDARTDLTPLPPKPFYGPVAAFTGNNQSQPAPHEDTPSFPSTFADPAPSPPTPTTGPKAKQLRAVQFSNSFTAWLTIQNLKMEKTDRDHSFLFLRHLNWSMQHDVAVDMTQPAGKRVTPIEKPVNPGTIEIGKGSNNPLLTDPIFNTSAIVLAPMIQPTLP